MKTEIRDGNKKRAAIVFAVAFVLLAACLLAGVLKADAFDAMNTNRVYRDKLPAERIIGEIENCKGKQFDPLVADVMLKLLSDGKIVCGE